MLEPFEHGRFIVRGELDPELRERLLAERATRAQPFRDDKALASWNGLALAAIAEAAYRFERDDWLERRARRGRVPARAAVGRGREAAALEPRRTGKWRGYLDDYANVAYGLLELHVATGELRWLLEAHRLALLAIDLFADGERGGFFLSPADGDERVPRTKDLQDTPIPSGNSMLAWVLLRLARIWGDDELERRACPVFRLVEPALRRAPGGVRVDALRARPLVQPAAGDRDRRRRRRRRSLAPRSHRSIRAVVAVGPSDEVRSWRARASSTAGRPSTSVSASPAGEPVTDPGRTRSPTDARLPDDRGPGGRDLGRLGAPRGAHRAHGLEGLFRSDHYTAIIRPDADALDAWTTLAGLAAITERIRLGTLVSPATFRHPSVLARMAATVDHISRGRMDVGMGSGWYEREHVAHGFPFLDAEAAVRALRRAGRGRRSVLDRGALRSLRACVRAP